jgi:hypothetical protein
MEARDRIVGVATLHGLEDPGIQSRWVQVFPRTSGLAVGTTEPPVQRVPGPFPGVKVTGTWRWLLTPSSAEVKERVELYLYSPSGRVNFTFYFTF